VKGILGRQGLSLPENTMFKVLLREKAFPFLKIQCVRYYLERKPFPTSRKYNV